MISSGTVIRRIRRWCALGEGLDEKAIRAVMKYKFRPGMKGGKPIAAGPVDMEVHFRLY